jgi:hypothetical protein
MIKIIIDVDGYSSDPIGFTMRDLIIDQLKNLEEEVINNIPSSPDDCSVNEVKCCITIDSPAFDTDSRKQQREVRREVKVEKVLSPMEANLGKE